MAVYKPPLQLQIPVALPGVLKDYTKAVLLSQPTDLYLWSAEYFRELAEKGSYESLVVGDSAKIINSAADAQKEQLEENLITYSGWRSIYNQLSDSPTVSFETLRKQWSDGGFSLTQLKELLTVGEFYSGEINLNTFTALVCGSLASNLTKTMHLALMLLSDAGENDLKSARVRFDVFQTMYTFMASLDSDISTSTVEKVLQYLQKVSSSLGGGGYVCAADFLNKSCPKLE